MSEVVAAFAANVPPACQASCCKRHGCSVDLGGCSEKRAIVDMDCLALPIPDDRERCDYVYVGEEVGATWVVPIELKGGGIGNVNEVLRQLEGGAMVADAWLPEEATFDFLPVVAHGKPIRKRSLDRLRVLKVALRGKRRAAEIVPCGGPLQPLLAE